MLGRATLSAEAIGFPFMVRILARQEPRPPNGRVVVWCCTQSQYHVHQRPMSTVNDLCRFLDDFAPPELAEDWDNVGLLVGDPQWPVERLMTCLTLTPASVAEAVEREVQLVVAHHPLPFRPVARITSDTIPGNLLLQLIRGGVAVYSPHTAFDSAGGGINQRLATGLGLDNIEPLEPTDAITKDLGSGRWGRLKAPLSLADFAARVKQFLGISHLKVVGNDDRQIATAAVACGSAGQFLARAAALGCDALVTGETNFHTCLEAEATGIALVLPGHFASERFGVEALADELRGTFPSLEVWVSQHESDPLRWV